MVSAGSNPRVDEVDRIVLAFEGQIPVGTVDVLLPLLGATAPAELLPERQPKRGFFEPLAGLAMREMFETAVFTNLFGSRACSETLGLWR